MDSNDTELDTLILALLDNDISPNEHAQLQARLKIDPRARERYKSLADLQNLLECEAEQHISSQKVELLPMEKIVSRQRVRFATRSIMAAAALILLTGLVLQVIILDHASTGPTTAQFSKFSDFTLTHTAEHSDSSDDMTIHAGSTLELYQGTAEINFAAGVTAFILAPAKLTLKDPSTLDFESGTGWFNVPAEAVGFTVNSAQLKIVDLGTQFGVIAANNSMHEIHVFKGRVEAQCLYGEKQKMQLIAGNARRTSVVGKLETTELNDSAFLKTLPRGLTYLHWNLDSQKSNTLSVQGNLASTANISSRFTGKTKQVESPSGKATQFTPSGGHLTTSWSGIGADRPRTISGWIKCPPQQPKHDNAIAEWGITLSTADSSKWRVNLNPSDNCQGALRTEFGQGYVVGTTNLRDGKWHHFASVYDGSGYGSKDTILLYIDGTREAISHSKSNTIRTNLESSISIPLRMGSNFNGSIDDLHIYNGQLPESEISRQANSNK